MKRSLILIISAAVVVVLVGALVLVKNLPKKAPKAAPVITINTLSSDKIAQIVLHNNGNTVTLKQVNKKWDVVTPRKYEWDSTSIRSIVNTFTSMVAQRIIEKNPTDLAQFGLNPPVATAVATLTDGSTVEFEIGNKTPTNTAYYFMKKSDKALYTVLPYDVTPLLSTINDLRNKQLTSINTQKLTYLKLTQKGTTIEVKPIPPGSALQAVAFSNFELAQPYKTPHAVATDKLNTALKAFPSYLTIQSFVSNPSANLSQYGLGPDAMNLVLKDDKNVLDIDLGKKLANGNMYAKLPNKPSVFEVSYSDFKSLITLTPFELMDKFLLIPNIANVDGIEIKTPQKNYTAVIVRVPKKGAKPDSSGKIPTVDSYSVNGKVVKESDFKTFYQNVIGLLADSPNPKPNIAFKPEITVTFHLNKGPQRTYSEYLVPYNRDFYAVFLNGSSQVLLDRDQVKKMITSAEDVIAGKTPPA